MATVHDLLEKKGGHVWSIGKDASVLTAAQLMNANKIGSLVVVDGERVEGIFTERDVLTRIVAGQRDPVRTSVAEVMTREVVCCTPATELSEVRGAMKNRRIRHLPVVDGDRRLQGLISIGDLNAHEAATQEQTIYLMQEYLYGRT